MSKTITISEETYESIKDQLKTEEKIDISCLDDLVGKKFLFRTVTVYHTGKVESVKGGILELSNAAWIANTGRFMQAIKNGELSEVEPVGQVFIKWDTVVDFFPWNHELPKEQI